MILFDAGVAQKVNKCSLLTKTIEYLTPAIRTEGLEIASHTTDNVKGLKVL